MSSSTAKPAYVSNPIYSALTSANAPFSLGYGQARRFQPGTIPFAAVPEVSPEALADLSQLLALDEEIFLTADAGGEIQPIAGLELDSTLPSLQMRFIGSLPSEENDSAVIRLTSNDTEEMLELKARAFPGFFGPRAPELGNFFGIRELGTGRLIAMGGERLATDTDREISAVCTDPEHLGRGYAARIMRAVLHHQARLGTGSILHVAAANSRAIALYGRMGFCTTGSIDFVKLRRVRHPLKRHV